MTDSGSSEQDYLDAGVAMARVDADEGEPELYEWHQCSDQPACSFPRGCPCAGKPYPSEVVRAAVDSGCAAGSKRERDRLENLLRPYVHSLEQIAEGPWSRYLDGRAASLARLIRYGLGDGEPAGAADGDQG